MTSARAVVNGISVDLEDWFPLVRRRLWGREDGPTDRVVRATERVLTTLDDAGAKATFFVLGTVADAFPDLVREIARRGHDIATHGHTHRRVDAIGPEEFRTELRRSREAIERSCGRVVIGHRAPEFSITPRTPWAFDVLSSEGFAYDSSVFPIRHPRYGIPDAPSGPYTVASIRELPLATWTVAGRRLPAAGGGYLRYLPYRMIEAAVRQANARGDPAILYVHPYEFDPSPLRFAEDPPTIRGRLFVTAQNAFRDRVPHRLLRLLRSFRFAPLADIAHA